MPTSTAPDRPTLRRHPERGSEDRAALDAVLDDVLVGMLAVAVDGAPRIVPLLFARDGDRILLHGSTGAGVLGRAADGEPVAFSVARLDGLVVGHTTFASSATYSSAVVYGRAERLAGDDAATALVRLSERLLPGRAAEVRPSTRRELAATLVVAVPILDGQWLVKARSGGASQPDEPTTAWCGVIPLHTVAGVPEPADWATETAVPDSVRRFVSAHPAQPHPRTTATVDQNPT